MFNPADAKYGKSLLKKLRQIEALKEVALAGGDLNRLQQDKLTKEGEVRAAIASITSTNQQPAAAAAAADPQIDAGGSQEKQSTAAAVNRKRRRMEGQDQDQDQDQDEVQRGAAGAAAAPSGTGEEKKQAKKKKKRLRGAGGKAAGWIKSKVAEHGPILTSMLGRMFQQEHGEPFQRTMGMPLAKWLANPPIAVNVAPLKGNEHLVSSADEDVTAAIAAANSKPSVLRRRLEAASVAEEAAGEGWDDGVEITPPFEEGDRVLAVGEGDFSWAASLVGGCSGVQLVATSYDSLDACKRKYKRVVTDSLKMLAAAEPHATVIHDFDATKIGASLARHQQASSQQQQQQQQSSQKKQKKQKKQRNPKFDFVVFNFPHTGSDEGLSDSIRSNRKLVQQFTKSAADVLKPEGEIHITVVNRYPYSAWKVSQLEAVSPALLEYCGTVPFDPMLYPGYKHVTTSMDGRDSRYESESALTYIYKKRA